MIFAVAWRNLKRAVHNSFARQKLTVFHIVPESGLGESINEEKIPQAIIIQEVHASELSSETSQAYATMESAPPVPVLLALSYLLALALFFSAD